MTTANDKAFPRCSRQPRPARLPSRSQAARALRRSSTTGRSLRKNPPAREGGNDPPAEVGSGKQSHLGTKRGSDVARICAGPASGCDARALPLPWCRRPSSLPYSYLQRLAELLVARRCCCQRRRGRLVLPARGRSRCPLDAPHSPPPLARCSPLRWSRASLFVRMLFAALLPLRSRRPRASTGLSRELRRT